MNDTPEDQPMKSKVAPCACMIVLGLLVIVFAWWNIRWSPIILTLLGAVTMIRGLVNQCCCAGDCRRSSAES